MQWAVNFGHTYLLIKPEWPWKVIREFGLLPFIHQVVMAFGERSVLLGARWWWTFLLLHVWHSVTKGKCYHIFLTSVQTLPPHSSHHFVSWIETFLFFRTFLKKNTVSVISVRLSGCRIHLIFSTGLGSYGGSPSWMSFLLFYTIYQSVSSCFFFMETFPDLLTLV